MSWLRTLRGQVAVLLIILLSLAQVLGLWLYVRNSEETAALLHDSLQAQSIAAIVRAADQTAGAERSRLLKTVSGSGLRAVSTIGPSLESLVNGPPRAHAFEHLVAIELDRRGHQGIRVAYLNAQAPSGSLLAVVQASVHEEPHHLLKTPLGDIRSQAKAVVEVPLSDGNWLQLTMPVLSTTPFSLTKLAVPLSALLASGLLIATWLLHRWSQSLSQFVSAAHRLGRNINVAPLVEKGPQELRVAASAINQMQDRIQRLLADRTAFAAAIAHDLGTPLTRLNLRLFDLHDEALRKKIEADLHQMRGMISSTLEFARVDFIDEPFERIDLGSLLESVVHDFVDAGKNVAVTESSRIAVQSRPNSLRRAISNLVDNAVKYGGCARIAARRVGSSVLITISDDGPGIDEELIEEAFRPFRRLHAVEEGGTGLGLSIARSIVRSLGGDITLTNESIKGVRATIALVTA